MRSVPPRGPRSAMGRRLPGRRGTSGRALDGVFARRFAHRRHYLGVARAGTATSGSLTCSSGYGSVTDLAELPGSGGVAHRTPVDLPTGRAGVAPLALAAFTAGLIVGLADRRSAHPGSRGAGLPRRSLPPASASLCGTSTGTRDTTCPATACCSRRSPRCSACACWRRSRCSSRRCCSSGSSRPVYGRCGGWSAALFAVAAVGDVWTGRLTFALGVAFALAAGARIRARAPRARGPAGGACARRRARSRARCSGWRR